MNLLLLIVLLMPLAAFLIALAIPRVFAGSEPHVGAHRFARHVRRLRLASSSDSIAA